MKHSKPSITSGAPSPIPDGETVMPGKQISDPVPLPRMKGGSLLLGKKTQLGIPERHPFADSLLSKISLKIREHMPGTNTCMVRFSSKIKASHPTTTTAAHW
jgi:hypothetical protein